MEIAQYTFMKSGRSVNVHKLTFGRSVNINKLRLLFMMNKCFSLFFSSSEDKEDGFSVVVYLSMRRTRLQILIISQTGPSATLDPQPSRPCFSL